MANYKNKTAIPQYLMPPAIVSLSGTESEFLRENLEFFQNLGFQIEDYPNAYAQFACEITLPLHTCLTDEQQAYVIECYLEAIRKIG